MTNHFKAIWNLTIIHRGNLVSIAAAYRGWLVGRVHIFGLNGQIVRGS